MKMILWGGPLDGQTFEMSVAKPVIVFPVPWPVKWNDREVNMAEENIKTVRYRVTSSINKDGRLVYHYDP